MKVPRIKKIGISLSVLLMAHAAIAFWILLHVMKYGGITLVEPIRWILVIETIGLGVCLIFALVCLVYFIRVKV